MEEKFELKKIIFVIILLVIIFGIFYGLTILIMNNKEGKEPIDESINYDDAIIDYDTILVKNIYNQSEEIYYVLASTLDDNGVFDNDLNNYLQKENALKIYYIDLSSAFNKNYVSSESNFDSRYPIFNDSTLLKIENDSIVETYVGKDDINTYLNILISEE